MISELYDMIPEILQNKYLLLGLGAWIVLLLWHFWDRTKYR